MNDLHNIKIFVLAPGITTDNDNINYYYDFSQSIEEYIQVFAELNLSWQWVEINLSNYQSTILSIKEKCSNHQIKPVFFNLCDGDEVNNTPGISVIKFLHLHQLIYTGSQEYFYNITTSKEWMKNAFDEHNVTNANWLFIENINDIDNDIFEKVGSPIIVKPAISGGSMGVGISNVVHSIDDLTTQVNKMFDGYNGWQLNAGGVIAEQFIAGREFTVLITGNYFDTDSMKIYTPIERVFHSSLKEQEKFLSFDRLWEIYESETPMPNDENFYEYALPENNLFEPLKQLSLNAFLACKGTGYARVDIRMEATTQQLFVLEINAQCGISEDENYTSIGAILKFNNASFSQLVKDIIGIATNL